VTALGDVLQGLRETIVLNERLELLAKQVDQVEARQRDLTERMIRMETFVDLVQPAVTRRVPPAGDN
jgi:hypothetical protein